MTRLPGRATALPVLFLLSLPVAAFLSTCGGSGGSNGGDDPVALCKQGCDVYTNLCFPDAGIAGGTAKGFCQDACNDPRVMNARSCSNGPAIVAAYKACLGKQTCQEVM